MVFEVLKMGNSYKWQDLEDAKAYQAFLKTRPEVNFLQALEYCDFALKLGKQVCLRVCLDERENIVASYLAIVEIAKRGDFLGIQGGPLLDFNDLELLKSMKYDLLETIKRYNCVFARLRPQVEQSDKLLKLMESLKFKRSPMHLSLEHAGILDLNLSDKEIEAGMSKSLKRNIKQAQKKGVTVKVTKSLKAAEQFADIHLDHAQRKSYIAFSREHLVGQFEAFVKSNKALIYIARLDGQILSMMMLFFTGREASYHYAVSTGKAGRLSSPPLLHLEAFKECRKRDIEVYNFWGIAELNQTKHRYYGVSQFKRSFGVTSLYYLPHHDLVVKKFHYLLTWIFETIRRKRRNL